jgi:uncharacterized membrane protein YccC
MDVGRIEKIEADLDSFIERRARKAGGARDHANEEAERWREKDARYKARVQLVHARAWAEHYGALALASHDAAARYARKREEALALVKELEADDKGGTAA